MGPIEEPFSYSKQQKDPPALPPHRIRFPGNHLLLLEAIAHHNGQVIHPLRLLARETTTAPGRHSSSPSPSTFPRCEVLGGKKKEERRKGREGDRQKDRKMARGERKDWRHTRAHLLLCQLFFVLVRYFVRHSRLLSTVSRKPPRSGITAAATAAAAAAVTAGGDANSETIVPFVSE